MVSWDFYSNFHYLPTSWEVTLPHGHTALVPCSPLQVPTNLSFKHQRTGGCGGQFGSPDALKDPHTRTPGRNKCRFTCFNRHDGAPPTPPSPPYLYVRTGTYARLRTAARAVAGLPQVTADQAGLLNVRDSKHPSCLEVSSIHDAEAIIKPGREVGNLLTLRLWSTRRLLMSLFVIVEALGFVS